MNVISISLFNYINIALSAVFILFVTVFKSENTQLLVTILPLIVIALNGYLLSLKANASQNVVKNIVLGGFISSILVAFAPYILQYTSNKSLFFSSLIFTILLLINIFIVKLNNEEKA
jgi:hypothetical protein